MGVNPKLVIFFHPRFSDGGVERTNIYLGKGLLGKGYEVVFLTTIATDHFRFEVKQEGIDIVELGDIRTLRTIKKVVRYLLTVSSQYSRVYYVSCQYYVNIVTMLVAIIAKFRCQNIRFINSERNHLDELRIKGGVKNALVFRLLPVLYRFADVIVANSRETASDLSRFIGRDVLHVYNPTINPRIEFLRNEPITEDWFYQDARPFIAGIGRLSQQKDFSTLLKAFRIVRDNLNVKLVVFGEGELRQDLEREIIDLNLESDVYLAGFVSNPYKFLSSAEAFVLSSKYEGLPNVLIEAVYLGVPAVSTRCKSGPTEILLDGKAGELVPVGDSVSMAKAILRVLKNRERALAKAKRAMDAAGRFTYSAVIDQFDKAINS